MFRHRAVPVGLRADSPPYSSLLYTLEQNGGGRASRTTPSTTGSELGMTLKNVLMTPGHILGEARIHCFNTVRKRMTRSLIVTRNNSRSSLRDDLAFRFDYCSSLHYLLVPSGDPHLWIMCRFPCYPPPLRLCLPDHAFSSRTPGVSRSPPEVLLLPLPQTTTPLRCPRYVWRWGSCAPLGLEASGVKAGPLVSIIACFRALRSTFLQVPYFPFPGRVAFHVDFITPAWLCSYRLPLPHLEATWSVPHLASSSLIVIGCLSLLVSSCPPRWLVAPAPIRYRHSSVSVPPETGVVRYTATHSHPRIASPPSKHRLPRRCETHRAFGPMPPFTRSIAFSGFACAISNRGL